MCAWRVREATGRLERDFTGDPVIRTPPSNSGDTGSVPDWGTKISHGKKEKAGETGTSKQRAVKGGRSGQRFWSHRALWDFGCC